MSDDEQRDRFVEDEATLAAPFSGYSNLILFAAEDRGFEEGLERLRVERLAERCLVGWLGACEGVSEAARVALLSRERDVVAALMVSDGRVCFGSSSVNVEFVSERLGGAAEAFQRTLREVRLRSVRLGALTHSDQQVQRDAAEVRGRLRALMARLMMFVCCAVRGEDEELPRQLTVTRPIDPRYVQDRPTFSGLPLWIEAMRQLHAPPPEPGQRFFEAMSVWAEDAWVMARSVGGGLPHPIFALNAASRPVAEAQAIQQFTASIMLSSSKLPEIGGMMRVSVLNVEGGFWCCAVLPDHVLLLRCPSSRLGLVVSEIQRL